jgi:peptidoglycan/LPS O-acetylase OafA/YrhL
MKRIELVEFLKGYSILTIILFHFLQRLQIPNIGGKLIGFGGTGVHLFILLSGFGLYYSHVHKPLGFIAFLKKRISKIYFPYIAIVLVSALITLFIPIYQNSWYALGGHIFLYKMFDESIIGSYGYPLWFISMIIQFYLVFNLLVWFKVKIGNKWFIVICLIISLLWTGLVIGLGKETLRVWNSFFLRYLWEFAIGMVIAYEFKRNNYQFKISIKTSYILIIGLVNCALYAGLALKGGEIGKMTNDIPALIGYSSLAIWVYLAGIKVINSFFLYTGKISYSMYLLHTLVLMIVLYQMETVNLYIALVIALISVYLISGLFQKSVNFICQKL